MDESDRKSEKLLEFDDQVKQPDDFLDKNGTNLAKKLWIINVARLPKVVLNVSFAVFSAIFAFSVSASPVLVVGGFVLALVFAGRAADEIFRIFNNSSGSEPQDLSDKPSGLLTMGTEEEGSSPQKLKPSAKYNFNWKRPGVWKNLSSGALGIGLILFGVALFVMPASVLGALAGLGIFAKISAIIAGVIFAVKSLFDEKFYFKGSEGWFWAFGKLKVNPALDFVLYGVCTGLGIAAALTGGFGTMPLVFAAVFSMYAAASLLFVLFQADEGKSKIVRYLKSAALGLMGLTLAIGGVVFAPALFGTFGLTATLFAKIASIFMGVVFLCAAVSKFTLGDKISRLDLELEGGSDRAIYPSGDDIGDIRWKPDLPDLGKKTKNDQDKIESDAIE